MLSKVLYTAILATILSVGLAEAQSLARIGGPANLPPAGFSGQQFVDNRGCLFLKAGFGATVNWVPRVDRRHKPLCGFPPTFGAAVIAAVDANMAPDPEALVVAAPLAPAVAEPVVVAPSTPRIATLVAPARPTVAAATPQPQIAVPAARPHKSLMEVLFGTPQNARVASPSPEVATASTPVVAAQPVYATAELAEPASGQIGCWTSAPRLERVLLRNGNTALVCTRGDGTLTGWRSPSFPRNAGAGAALNGRQVTAEMMVGATVLGTTRTAATAAATNAIPTPPKGYKLAWNDDRLNPLRGVGTAIGQAQQDQVWTRDVPAVLVTAAPQPTAKVTARPRVTLSTMSAPETPALATPTQPAAQGGFSYIQIGTFGQPANADNVRARLKSLGLPVATSKISRKGKVLQVVYAGPFRSASDARNALGLARGAGFADAVLK